MSIGINVGYGIPSSHWVFAPSRYMGYHNINRYYVRPANNTTIIRNTTVINNTTVYNNRKFVAGPNRAEVEKYSGKKINTVKIVNASKPGNSVAKNAIQMYRPGVKAKVQQKIQNRQQNNVTINNNQGQQNKNQQIQDQVNKGRNYIQNNRTHLT